MKEPETMKPLHALLPALVLLSACGSLRDTAMVNDDVYNIPDRAALAYARSQSQVPESAAGNSEDYYDPGEAKRSNAGRDYYDLAYNDPYYYNYGRFGLGVGLSGFGPGYGMGMSYGWPTTFGSMGLGMSYTMGYGGLYGYDPYWSNSWMSGYGYSPFGYSPWGYGPYGYNPYGYYGYNPYGYYGYGGYGGGYGPYYSPWGNCYSCYEPVGYGSVYSHRPTTTGSSTGSTAGTPRSMRNPAGLLQDPSVTAPARSGYLPEMPVRDSGTLTRPSRNSGTIPAVTRPSSTNTFDRPSRELERPATGPDRQRERTRTAPSRGDWSISPSAPSSPSPSIGGGGGGRITSPRR